MLLGKTETSSAGEQLARDNLNERQKTKTKRVTNLFLFLEFFMPLKTHTSTIENNRNKIRN